MKPIYSGKVREIYDVSDKNLVIVTTDRVSAYDSILPMPIKNKGVVLNQISNFWFSKTADIVPNHIVETDIDKMPSFFRKEEYRDRTVMVRKLKMLPYEFVMRGYIFGNMWKAYEAGEAFCGIKLSGEYRLAQKLDQPILTPSIKRDVGHDEYVDIGYVESDLGASLTKQIADICFKLYEKCSAYALTRGLIIADTKFEFGLDENGQLVLADEIFTPDSSRFWDAAHYEVGVSPRSYDKQLLRDWLTDNKVNGEYQFDKIPSSVLEKTEQIYLECLDRLVK